MEPREAAAPSSFQARLWKNLQLGVGKGKGGGGARAGGPERRTADTPSPSPPPPGGGRWSGFKKRKQVLDRVFSSSQPNLCCSSPEPLEPGGGGRGERGATLRRRIREHLLPAGKGPGADSAPSSSSASSSLSSSPQPPARGARAPDEGARRRGPEAHLCHQKSSSLPGTACLEQLLQPPPPPPPPPAEPARSPETREEPGSSQVFDYDFGLQDDFMGSAFLDLTQLELNRPTDVTLTLKDPHYPDHYLGIILLSVILTPKEGEHRDVTMLMRKSWKRSSKDLSENEVVGSYFSVKSFFWRTCSRPALPVLGFCKAEFQSTCYQNAQFQTQSLRLSDVHRKSQLWRGIVSITLIEGRDLKAMDSNGLSDPYVKFRLGHQKYKSKIMPKTLNPQWREQFDFHLYEERGGIIDITAWDKDAGKRDDFIGRCQVDLSALSREQTHKLELQLEEGEGHLVLLVTLTASATVSISDLSVNSLEDQKEREEILRRYSPLRIFHNLKDVGFLQVKVIRAEGLMVADVTGKSDPFCVVELNNDRLLTHTVYKNLNPEWNKIFTFNIKDIHSVLEVTVYDEDRDRSADFLGKVAIPLLSIQNGEQKAYVLKNKQLTGPTKGVIYLEIDVIFNAVKASLRTLIPKEQKYIEEENRLSKQLLLRNFIRMKRCVMVLVNAAYYVNSCFDWDSPPRSLAAFVLFLFVVWNFELYMIPLVLLLLLTWNYFLIISGKDNRQRDTVVEDMLEDEEEEDDKDDKDSEKKGFINKIYAIQEVCISVQNILDEVASFGERIKNTFNWTVPFLSWLAIVALCVFTVILYFIPLRYIVLVWGINKFTKKLRSPYAIDNNELLDFLSRVPSDVQVVQYQELKPDPSHSPCKRKKNNLG
ncbi:unnamed protein product [Nyctereutes procyonoides]|uniref:(raccoon dog) hypothetical protein n=1 Tax=Nyctereutes procyonoides TaxID=34880 RepID=A0A811ZYU3_NYCPR|nr:unnamed protein product [Nyctereutes procyonoides]